MAKRIISCLSFTIIFSLILYNLQWADSIACAADTSSADNITIIECKDIQHVGAQQVEAHYDGKELKLIGITNDGKQFIIARTKLKKEVVGGVFDYDCTGNTVRIIEKQAFSTLFTTQIYKWTGKNLRHVKTIIEDTNANLIDSALSEALKGNLIEAYDHLNEVQHYPRYYLGCGTIEHFLEEGHKASLSLRKTKGFKQAAVALENTFELMVKAYNCSFISETEISTPIPNRWLETFKHCEISTSKYVPALNDYGFFLQQTGQNDKAANILLLVVSEDPKRTVAYLNLADAYWSLGKRQIKPRGR